MTLLAGLASAILLWWIVKSLTGAQPAKVARLARWAGGSAAIAAAALLAFRGRIDMAMLLGSGGAWLLGWNVLPAPFGQPSVATAASPGAVSRVRSATVEMALDHDTGRIGGSVLAGPLAGRELDSLSGAEILALRRSCLAQDPDGARLLEPYLDRRFPAWREDAEPDPDRGGRPDAKLGAMTKEEAYQVLGLQPGADPEAVRAAHRGLMKKLHPDQGGSTYLASRVNQAKDVLLDRHR